MGKRSYDDPEKLMRKLRRLEKKIKKAYHTANDVGTNSLYSDQEVFSKTSENREISPVVINNTLSPLHFSEAIAVEENPIDEATETPSSQKEGINKKHNGENLHDDITKRWECILKKGISKDTFDAISKKYELPSNCTALVPTKLNEEISAAMNDAGIKRDKRIVDKQSKVATTLAALRKLMNNLLKNVTDENLQNIEILSEASRILCDVFYMDSTTRRALIIPGLNKEIKDLLEERAITDFLCGDDLQEKVKACKATKKSAMEMKDAPVSTKNKVISGSPALNLRGPLRQLQQQKNTRQSGQKQPYQQRYIDANKKSQITSSGSSRYRQSSFRQQVPRRR